MSVALHHGDCRDVMAAMEPNSIDAIVTDPPYDLTNRVPDVKKCRVCDRVIGGSDGKPPACPRCGGELYNQRTQAKGGGFMGKDWDATGIAFNPETWAAAYRVLKPGGHLLAFSGTRTSHRMVCAIEDAGFEIRDSLIWMYGSGMPKSLNVSKALDKAAGAEREIVGVNPNTRPNSAGMKSNALESKWSGTSLSAPTTDLARQWDGWGTALKPAHEPICLARKPLIGTVVHNVEAHGTGALNINGCRIDGIPSSKPQPAFNSPTRNVYGFQTGEGRNGGMSQVTQGRWPSNISLGCACDGDEHDVECAVAMLDAQIGHRRSSGIYTPVDHGDNGNETVTNFGGRGVQASMYSDSGGPSRFFYCAKASRAERNAGLEGMDERVASVGNLEAAGRDASNPLNYRGGQRARVERGDTPSIPRANHHPTVKPIALMRYLVRLVTPPDGTVLDPFMGSGSTGCAVVMEGFNFIGIEQDAEYIAIAEQRIAHYTGKRETDWGPLFAGVEVTS